MKKLGYIIFIAIAFFVVSCVDDFEDANSSRRLDSPAMTIYVGEDIVQEDNDLSLKIGESITFSVDVTDAPGKIDSFAVNADAGTLTFDAAALEGKEVGKIDVVYTAPLDQAGTMEIDFVAYDKQDPRKVTTVTRSIEVLYLYPGPTLAVSPGAGTSVQVLGGQSQTYNLTVNAEGGIGGVIANIVQGKGTLTVDEAALNDVKGKTTGVIPVTFTASNQEAGQVVLNFSVYDNTTAKRGHVTNGGNPYVRGINVDCSADASIVGTYVAESSGMVGLADTAYTDLVSEVIISQKDAGVGIFNINDVSFGVYGDIYDRKTLPAGNVNVCEGSITERTITDIFGESFVISGKVNSNNTITIYWENSAGDNGDVTLTKK